MRNLVKKDAHHWALMSIWLLTRGLPAASLEASFREQIAMTQSMLWKRLVTVLNDNKPVYFSATRLQKCLQKIIAIAQNTLITESPRYVSSPCNR